MEEVILRRMDTFMEQVTSHETITHDIRHYKKKSYVICLNEKQRSTKENNKKNIKHTEKKHQAETINIIENKKNLKPYYTKQLSANQ